MKRLLVTIVCLITAALLLQLSIDYASSGGDFVQDYIAANAYLKGYSVYLTRAEFNQLALFDPPLPINFRLNAHPPIAALLHLPIATFDFKQAFTLWNVVNLLLIVIATFSYIRRLKSASKVPFLISQYHEFLLPLVLLSFPVISQVATGQYQGVLLLLLVVFIDSVNCKRFFIGGLFFGLLVLLKMFPVLFALPVLLRSNTRTLVTFSVGILCGVIPSLIFTGIDSYNKFTETSAVNLAIWSTQPANQSMLGFLSVFLGGANLRIVYVLLSIIICIYLSLMIAMRRNNMSDTDALELTLVVSLLLSPLCWSHYFILLIPVIFSNFIDWNSYDNGPKKIYILSLFLLLMPDVLVASDIPAPPPNEIQFLQLFVKSGFFGLLSLTVFLLLKSSRKSIKYAN